jgi:acetylglutamate kinase
LAYSALFALTPLKGGEGFVEREQYAPNKGRILAEALPYIRRFYGKTMVVKYGGAAMDNPSFMESVSQDIALLKFVGMNPIVVHGGGSKVNQFLRRLGIEAKFINGLRVTDESTMEVVEMVLAGSVNKEIVALINRSGGKAIGLSGKDADIIVARKKEGLDLGLVGDVVSINAGAINTLCQNGFIPVIAPIGVGEDGETYNINADSVAGRMAAGLGAERLIILTNVKGIMRNPEDSSTFISSLKVDQVLELIDQGVISGGMVPKAMACVEAVKGGVEKAHIIDGRMPHSLLLELLTDEGVGTEITM